jgi:hypothetical protein
MIPSIPSIEEAGQDILREQPGQQRGATVDMDDVEALSSDDDDEFHVVDAEDDDFLPEQLRDRGGRGGGGGAPAIGPQGSAAGAQLQAREQRGHRELRHVNNAMECVPARRGAVGQMHVLLPRSTHTRAHTRTHAHTRARAHTHTHMML